MNYRCNVSSQFHVLTADQCEEIYLGALQVLSDTGILVRCSEALEILRQNGAWVQGERAHIPAWMVERARSSAPSSFTLYSRDGNPSKDMTVAPNRTAYGPAPAAPHVQDPTNGQRRVSRREDVAAAAKVCDALPHIHWASSMAMITEVSPEVACVHEFADLIANTSKPLWGWSYSLDGCRDIHQIAIAVAGSEEALRHRPHYYFFCESMPPLGCDRHAAENIVYCARHGIPLAFAPVEMSGATAPATLAGTVMMAVVDSMLGLLLSQILSPGMPFMMGGTCTVLDMKTGLIPYGAPELSLVCAATADVARYLGVPHFTSSGTSDAMIDDNQAALDGTVSTLFTALCGSEVTHNVGMLEACKTGSLRYLVLMNEVIGYLESILGSQVGPVADRTAVGWTRSAISAELLDHQSRAAWEASGPKRLVDRAQDKLDWILSHHEVPPLEDQVQRRIEQILTASQARLPGPSVKETDDRADCQTN